MIAALALFVAAQRLPTPSEVVSRVRAVYAKARSYEDSIAVYENDNNRLTGKATLRFGAPREFRFSFHYLDGNRNTTISQDAKGRRRTTGKRPRPGEKVFRDKAFLIVDLLLGKKDTLLDEDWDSVAVESTGGHECYRLQTPKDAFMNYLWVDSKTYLVIKWRELVDKKAGYDIVCTYRPAAGMRR